MRKYVVFEVFVQLRRAVLHCLKLIKDEGKLLILHLYLAHCLNGGYLVLCYNGGDIVAIIAHMAIKKKPVRHVLMVRVGAPRMPRSRERYIRHVEAGDYFHHAWHLFSLARIYAFNIAVRDGGAHHLYYKRRTVGKIVGIFCASCYLVRRVYALYALSYNAHWQLLSCFNI